MDSFEINKIVGALTGMGAVFIALVIVSDVIYAPTAPKGDDHGDHHGVALAYMIPIEEEEDHGGGEEEEAPVSLAALIAASDASSGARVFNKCKSCHNADEGGANGIGPNLWGVMGAQVGVHAGFNYSEGLVSAGGGAAWDWESMSAFLENPKGWAPGTRMNFAGLGRIEERASLMVYLNEQGPNPLPLPVEE